MAIETREPAKGIRFKVHEVAVSAHALTRNAHAYTRHKFNKKNYCALARYMRRQWCNKTRVHSMHLMLKFTVTRSSFTRLQILKPDSLKLSSKLANINI